VLVAGIVGRAHGLGGSFYVKTPRVEFLTVGAELTVLGVVTTVVRRAGTDAHPILAVANCVDRAGAEALHQEQLLHPPVEAPPLGPDEYRAEDLEGARVVDGDHELGVVRTLIGLPSCECLSVERPDGGPDLLVPLVRDAIRSVDVGAGVITVDRRFLGE
jgi:16S rRNA processing protein RimM